MYVQAYKAIQLNTIDKLKLWIYTVGNSNMLLTASLLPRARTYHKLANYAARRHIWSLFASELH